VFSQGVEDGGDSGGLVVGVEAEEGCGDGVTGEELAGDAGVLGGDEGGVAEDAEGAEGDVFEVADGGGDYK